VINSVHLPPPSLELLPNLQASRFAWSLLACHAVFVFESWEKLPHPWDIAEERTLEGRVAGGFFIRNEPIRVMGHETDESIITLTSDSQATINASAGVDSQLQAVLRNFGSLNLSENTLTSFS
jgi:hypothetical protein